MCKHVIKYVDDPFKITEKNIVRMLLENIV